MRQPVKQRLTGSLTGFSASAWSVGRAHERGRAAPEGWRGAGRVGTPSFVAEAGMGRYQRNGVQRDLLKEQGSEICLSSGRNDHLLTMIKE